MQNSEKLGTIVYATGGDFRSPFAAAPKVRLDRAFSIGVMAPASRLFNRLSEPRIPILMYHGISADLRGAHPYFETNTAPKLFERHMQFLSANGYKTIGLEEVAEAFRNRHNTEKYVAVTFDDGYRDFYREAFPILRKYSLTATVYVVPGFADGHYTGTRGEEYMSWSELREISAYGIQIGSHTMTHPKLYTLHPSQINVEIRQSKELIQERLGIPVHSFAYPFAFPEQDEGFIRTLRSLLQTNDYRTGVCTIIGRARRGHDCLFFPRLPVNSYDDLRLFEVKLNGGYDWLQKVQYSTKLLKARFS
jgi:peptidoglycan/xylan/chitin deacetylase (PgdA/CDA1 family)